jgi:hypothetical protein
MKQDSVAEAKDDQIRTGDNYPDPAGNHDEQDARPEIQTPANLGPHRDRGLAPGRVDLPHGLRSEASGRSGSGDENIVENAVEISPKSLVTSPENLDHKSLVTSPEKIASQVTSDLLKIKLEKSTRKQKITSIETYKQKKQKKERRRRVSEDPDKPATPPSHQWRRVGNAWQLWRVTYSYLEGKQKKKFKFVNGSYLAIEAVREGKKKAYDQRRKNIVGSIFD